MDVLMNVNFGRTFFAPVVFVVQFLLVLYGVKHFVYPTKSVQRCLVWFKHFIIMATAPHFCLTPNLLPLIFGKRETILGLTNSFSPAKQVLLNLNQSFMNLL